MLNTRAHSEKLCLIIKKIDTAIKEGNHDTFVYNQHGS
jgi:hypothetical protein